MISFKMPATALENLSFVYSPLLETILSLHVLVEPKHHPVQHPWVRQMQKLPPNLKREVAAFSFAYRSYFPAFLFPSTNGVFLSFETELQNLKTLSPRSVSFEFTEPFCIGVSPHNPARLEDAALREIILQKAADLEQQPLSFELVKMALEEPEAFLERFIQFLAKYWEVAFEAEWKQVEEQLARNIAEAGRQIATEGLYPFLDNLWPELRTDKAAERFWIDRPHEHEVQIGPNDQLVLVPSIYVWPHIRINCDKPWPYCLVFPIGDVARRQHSPLPPQALLKVLRALADDVRLQALHLIAERPRSTQELAPLLGLSETALSKHLRLMAEAGVLKATRTGYYVLYSLAPEQIEAALSSLNRYIKSSPFPPETPSNNL